ncbi:MAG: hypothetical protein PHN18_01530 [Sulfurospirillaceae bacterium]|jgi:hypothetical protein|nr:hypothetical protein [Sulfurospirillaceae bacterium]MDD2827851.1 hypothetical protein [Sulfurospirillaceae bacterium]
MDAISSNVSTDISIYAMKKAIESQGDVILKVLESAQTPQTTPSQSGLASEGIGQTLDLRA